MTTDPARPGEPTQCICGHDLMLHDPSGRCHGTYGIAPAYCNCWAYREQAPPIRQREPDALRTLRELAEAVLAAEAPNVYTVSGPSGALTREWIAACSPDVILALIADHAALREALTVLIADIEAVLPWVRSADVMAYIHGARYDGPEGGIPAALDKARAALAPVQPAITEEK